MTDQYQPRYAWQKTQIDDRDPPTDFDWLGFEGAGYIGRIRKELHGPTKGQWHWSGSWPRTHKGRPPTPNAGYVATARQAVQMCEEYWERCKEVMTAR